ncbi:MAG: hypothetical protein KDA87_01440 [Planctomycetales bacterium]|nr:hypothetical protein [Planctomycetales bacterium]
MKRFFASLLVVGLIACGANAAIEPLNAVVPATSIYQTSGFTNPFSVTVSQNLSSSDSLRFAVSGIVQLNNESIPPLYNAHGEMMAPPYPGFSEGDRIFNTTAGGFYGELLIGNPLLGLSMVPLVTASNYPSPPGPGGDVFAETTVTLGSLWAGGSLSAGDDLFLAVRDKGTGADNSGSFTVSASAVPEPSAFAFGFLALGLVVGGKKLSRRFFNK